MCVVNSLPSSLEEKEKKVFCEILVLHDVEQQFKIQKFTIIECCCVEESQHDADYH